MPSISQIQTPGLIDYAKHAGNEGVLQGNHIERVFAKADVGIGNGIAKPYSSSGRPTMNEDVAARQITKGIRQFISGKSHERMIKNGTLWNTAPVSSEKTYVDGLSKANLRNLRNELGALTPDEKQFLNNYFESSLYATHSTGAPVKRDDGSVGLFLRQKLIDRNIIFNTENSPQEDIKILGNDDFVFFALEAGGEPKKPSSRFGGTTFRFDFESPAFKDAAWVSLVEMRFAQTPYLERHIEPLTQGEFKDISRRKLEPFQTVFSGEDMKAGIGLSIIKDLRKLPPESSKRLLAGTGEEHMNKLINGLYRPEIKVARHFFSDSYMEAAVKKDDKTGKL